MFVRTPLQVKLFPCDDKYNDREISDLQTSWAEILKSRFLPWLGTLEQEFAKFFHSRMGRPIKYISLLIVVHIFKELYDWTDEELLEHVKFDKRFEYAFDLPYHELVLSQKTLHNFRSLLNNHNMAQTVFDGATKHIAEIFNIDTSEQRLDSTHIVSNMARLSRLGLFVRVIENLLNKLKKIDPAAYEALPSRFSDRYGRRRGYFADARSKKTKARLGEAANDMYYLLDRFKEHDELSSMKVYEHLQRVFNEHCSVRQTIDHTEICVEEKPMPTDSTSPTSDALSADDASSTEDALSITDTSSTDDISSTDDTSSTEDTPEPVTVKEPKEMPSGTLQNPSDEDVTCGHKGPGYEATFAETCNATNPFQIITDVSIDTSNISDQHKTVPTMDRLHAKGMKPDTAFGDGTFTSGDNIVECRERGIDLQGNLVGADKEPNRLKLADFHFAEDGATMTACPAEHSPTGQRLENSKKPKKKSQQNFIVHFDKETCATCKLAGDCPVKLQKKKAVIRFSPAQLASSIRRREQNTEAFKERNNIRAGIEATNSEMKNSQGLGRLKVRGQPRVTHTVIFKALACNVKRMVKYALKELKKAETPKIEGNIAFSA